MSKPFSSSGILLSMLVVASTTCNGQSEKSSVLQGVKPNFYITTPQTGEQTEVGADGHTHTSPASTVKTSANQAAYNTYTKQSDLQLSYTPSASNQRSSRNSSNNYTIVTPQQSATAQQNTRVAATSARDQSSVQQVSYPSYVAHSTDDRRGLLSRILHKQGSSQKATVQQVSNNPSYKTSQYNGTRQAGMASWYGSDFHGGKTANGERYNMESMTAAHKSLPFGTLVKVRNERNGQECVVRINNRGPFTKGRILDLSKAAARQLGMISSGVAKVSMQVVGRS